MYVCICVYICLYEAYENNEDYDHFCTSRKPTASTCLTSGTYEVKHNKEQHYILISLFKSSLKSSITIFNHFYIQQTINFIDWHVTKTKLTHKLGKLVYNLSAIFFKILTRFSVYIYKFILKFIWKDSYSKNF